MKRRGIFNLAFDLQKQKVKPTKKKKPLVYQHRFDTQESIVLEFRNGVYSHVSQEEERQEDRNSGIFKNYNQETEVKKSIGSSSKASFSKANNYKVNEAEKEDGSCSCNEVHVKKEKPEQELIEEPEVIEEPFLPVPKVDKEAEVADLSLGEDDFTADLQAILKGEKVYDPGQKKAINVNAPEGNEAARRLQEEEKEEQPKKGKEDSAKNEHPHEIFDKLKKNFSEAKTFDLGSIEMEKRFEAFDDDLNLEEENGFVNTKDNVGDKSEKEEDWITDVDLVDDFERLGIEKKQGQKKVEAFSEEIPLSPETGGMSLHPDALEVGDVILSTTNARISNIIRRFTQSEVSHAAVYVGNGKVIEAIGGGVAELPLADSIAQDTVTVAFRHKDISPEKANKVKDFLVKKKEENARYDYWTIIKHPRFQIHKSICNYFEGENRQRCINFGGRIYLGTDNNDKFFCSELVVAAFEEAGIPITETPPNWSSPEDLVQAHYNNTLVYLGHLKTNL